MNKLCPTKSFLYNCQTWLRKKHHNIGHIYFTWPLKSYIYLPHDKDIDKPQIVFLSLIGNDVCNGRYPTEPHFTTDEEFRTKTLQTLDHLGEVSGVFLLFSYSFSWNPRRQNIAIWISCYYDWFGWWSSSLGFYVTKNSPLRWIQIWCYLWKCLRILKLSWNLPLPW